MKKITTKQLTTVLTLVFLNFTFTLQSQLPIYSETFTGNLGTTTAANGSNGNWIWSNSCSRSNLASHSAGGHAYYLGTGSSCQFGSGGNQVSGDLQTPNISIPSTGAYLTFNYSLNNECGSNGSTCNYDILKLQISNNGGSSFTDIMSSYGFPAGLVNGIGWVAVNYTLPATYNGQNIIVRFNFDSVDGFNNTIDGVYIDDIKVFGFCNSPVVSITASTDTICQGLPVTLTAGGTAVSYSLTTLGSISSTVANTSVLHIPLMNTTYVMLGEDATGCLGASAEQSVYVVQAPTVNIQFVYPTTICSGDNVTITINGTNNYTLDPGGFISTGSPFIVTPNATTNFSLVGTDNTGSGCLSYNTAVTTISVNPTPELSVNSGTICSGQGFTMYPEGGSNYLFSSGSSIVNPPVGIYSYTVNSTVDGCVGIPAVSDLTVYSMPNTNAIATKSNVCTTDAVKLYGYNAENFSWNTGATGSVVTVNHSNMTTGGIVVYTVTGFNDNGCSKTATVQVKVYICTGINEQQNNAGNVIVYPNPSNGEFTIETYNNFEKNITLIDLIGRVVMTHKTSSDKIDFNVNELSKGIYYLQVQTDSEKQTIKILKE